MNITNIRLSKLHVREALVMGLCCFISISAYAEGSKTSGGNAHGVNRFVYTNTGYVGVTGQVTIDYNMPTQHFLSYPPSLDAPSPQALFSSAKSFITQEVNPFDNKPSVYFGARLISGKYTDQVDAGIQMETNTFPEDGTGERNGRAFGGWSAFISYNTAQTNPSIYDSEAKRGIPWRGSKGIIEADIDLQRSGREKMTAGSSSISTLMTFNITLAGDPNGPINSNGAGGLSLSITNEGFGKFYWNPTPQNGIRTPEQTASSANSIAPWKARPDYVFNPNRLDEISIKRVVAMTRRDGGSTLDGSSMTGTIISAEVRAFNQSWGSWTSAIVDQAVTGYDAPDNNSDNGWDKRWPYGGGSKLFTSQKIVDISGDYANETVKINLETVSRPVGAQVKILGNNR